MIRTLNRAVAVVVALVGVLALAAPAHADRATAERYFRAGAKAYAAQRFAAAAANFDEAYRALPLPEIAFSTAQAYRRLYRIDAQPAYVQRAVELYRVYLAAVKRGGRVGDAADNLGELERELERLGARAHAKVEVVERTRLGIHVSLAGEASRPDDSALREIGDGAGEALPAVTATLDGSPVEPFALLEVAPGDHVIAVRAPGYFPVEKKQRAVQGATALVDVELRPRPARVSVTTEDGARIAVDGRAGTTMLELAAGTHLLTIVRRGRRPYAQEITVTRGQELAIAAPLAKTARRRAVPWVLGGAGVLALATTASATLAIVHDGRADDRRAEIDAGNAAPATADAYDHEIRQRDDYRTLAWVAGGAALAAGTVGLLLYAFDTPAAETVRLAPVAGPQGAGVSAVGRF